MTNLKCGCTTNWSKPALTGWRNTVVFQYNQLGAERLLIQNMIQSLQTICLVRSLGYPTLVVRALRFRQRCTAALVHTERLGARQKVHYVKQLCARKPSSYAPVRIRRCMRTGSSLYCWRFRFRVFWSRSRWTLLLRHLGVGVLGIGFRSWGLHLRFIHPSPAAVKEKKECSERRNALREGML